MKFKTLALAAILSASASGAAFAAGDDHSPKHGGIFIEGKVVDLEVIAKPDVIQVYVHDHGKAAKVDGAKGKVTLLNGSEKTEVELALAGGKLEAKGAFNIAKGTKGVASVTLPGKPTAIGRFVVK